jgi:amino acid adenylation domain-containing protein
LSYRELNRRANQLAHHLRSLGAGPNVLVGLCVKRSLDMVVGLLGILKAGAAYVPMDPSYPKERLQYILEDSNAIIVLTQESLIDGLPGFAGRAICLDKDWSKISGEPAENLSEQVKPEDLAYVIFTSGSTGRPKGVEISHGAVINFLNSMREVPGIEAQDTLLSVTTLSFDIFGLEIWLPLTSAAQVVIASEEVARDGKALAELILQSGATVMQATSSTWRLLLESGWDGNPHLKILCGGEAWPAQLAEQLSPMCASLWNMYGPTETTIWSAVHQVRAGVPVLIGHPIANTEFYVVDSHLQPVPVGVPGELLIGRAGVARGYLNRSELTAEKFIADPFRTEIGSRFYRTGDLVRYRADGNLEFLGRIDQQVKMRGFRIELGEIESVLRSHAAVREAVVVMREEREKQLIAYVVLAKEPSCTKAELRNYLKQKLPAYMVPADYVELDLIPLTPNGKVDRLALRAPAASASLDDASYLPPRDAYESLICKAWVDILGLKRVGIRDNFFDLGGHSLLAVQLMLRLQEIIPGEPLPLRAVLEAPTVEKFAAWLRNHKAGERQFLVRVRPGISERPPFFSVHGAGGNVLDMRALAMALPADLPFYCFEDKGLDGTPFESIEEAACCYIDEMRQVQPHGPYHLGGSCYGGIVAFEMARRLEELGEPVAALVLIDSLNPTFVRNLSKGQWLLRNVRFYTRRTVWHARRFFTQPPGEWLGYVSGPLKHFRYGMLDPAKAIAIHDEEMVSSIASNPIGEILKRIMRANLSARRKFLPKPYNGSALIFRAGGRCLYQYDDDCLGWGSVVLGGIECSEIKGEHESILDQPAVQLVAEKLDAKLKELAIKFSSNENQHAMTG